MQADPPRPTETLPLPALGVTELEALVDATRAIAEVLDLDPVLQLIVDRVRTLVGARTPPLGIADAAGGSSGSSRAGIEPEDAGRHRRPTSRATGCSG